MRRMLAGAAAIAGLTLRAAAQGRPDRRPWLASRRRNALQRFVLEDLQSYRPPAHRPPFDRRGYTSRP